MTTASRTVTIVVPVYADWPSLKDCLQSLKTNVDSEAHKVLVVNDCGPDADKIEKNILRLMKGSANFEYHRNPHNLGFVKTCNRAANELDGSDNDILLLNSDTKVTPGFLDEMLEVLYAEKNIGAVSPRSNNATICTVPLSAMRQKGITAEDSFTLFQQKKNTMPRYSTVPTAHGFCMLIRRSLISKYGLFDEVFGKGYGEEVDFCQRIKKHGWVCVLSNHSYVFHLEARSFSLDAKAKLVEASTKIIKKRYPDYQQAVADYIKQALEREEGVPSNNPQVENTTVRVRRLLTRYPRVKKLARKVRNKFQT